MYYPQDTPEAHGPTHVIAGTHLGDAGIIECGLDGSADAAADDDPLPIVVPELHDEVHAGIAELIDEGPRRWVVVNPVDRDRCPDHELQRSIDVGFVGDPDGDL